MPTHIHDKNTIIQSLKSFSDERYQNIPNLLIDEYLAVDLNSYDTRDLEVIIPKLENMKLRFETDETRIADKRFVDLLDDVIALFTDKMMQKRTITLLNENNPSEEMDLASMRTNIDKFLLQDSLTIQFNQDKDIIDLQIRLLLQILTEQPIKNPLTIIVTASIAPKAMYALAQYLQSENCPNKFILSTPDLARTENLKILNKTFAVSRSKEGLMFDFQEGIITEEGFTHLTKILMSGNLKKHFSIFLSAQQIFTEKMAEQLADAFKSGYVPEGFELSGGQLTKEISVALAKAFKSGRTPQNLLLNFAKVSLETIQPIIATIETGSAPKGFALVITSHGNALNADLGKALTMTLSSEKRPENLRIHITSRQPIDKYLEMLITNLANAKSRAKLELSFDISASVLKPETLTKLLDFLQSDQCSYNLTIYNLFAQPRLLSDDNLNKLANVLKVNTSLQMPMISGKGLTDDKLAVIKKLNLYLLRNYLLLTYPQHATFIKQHCQRLGLYDPKIHGIRREPTSLQAASAHVLFQHKAEIEDYEKALQDLPQPIQNFLNELELIQKKFHPSPTPQGKK